MSIIKELGKTLEKKAETYIGKAETYIGKAETSVDEYLSQKVGFYKEIKPENKKKLKVGTGLAVTALAPCYLAIPAGLYTYGKVRELVSFKVKKVRKPRTKVPKAEL